MTWDETLGDETSGLKLWRHLTSESPKRNYSSFRLHHNGIRRNLETSRLNERPVATPLPAKPFVSRISGVIIVDPEWSFHAARWLVVVASCTDTFIRFINLAATSAGRTQPERSVTTVAQCQARCSVPTCVGFNWVETDQRCFLYSSDVGSTTQRTGYDLYIRQTCQQGLRITFAPGNPLF